MTEPSEPLPRDAEIESLLPWHAAGTLDARDAEQVERALAADPELARRYELVREELYETIGLNESLGAPSPQAAAKLFSRIEHEGRRAPIASRAGAGLRDWLERFFPDLSPRALAWSAVAGVVIAVQAAFIASFLIFGPVGEGRFQVASVPTETVIEGSHVLIGFRPGATAAEISALLQEFEAVIVDGPRAGGLYRVRVGAAKLGEKELDRIVAAMREREHIVRMVAATD